MKCYFLLSTSCKCFYGVLRLFLNCIMFTQFQYDFLQNKRNLIISETIYLKLKNPSVYMMFQSPFFHNCLYLSLRNTPLCNDIAMFSLACYYSVSLLSLSFIICAPLSIGPTPRYPSYYNCAQIWCGRQFR